MNGNIFFKVGNNKWENDPWFCDALEHKNGELYFNQDIGEPYVYWDGKWNKIECADIFLKDLDAIKFTSSSREEVCQNEIVDIDIMDLI